MALKLKACDEDSSAIPGSILERLSLKEGDTITVACIEKGDLAL